jgi:hypothetical protein
MAQRGKKHISEIVCSGRQGAGYPVAVGWASQIMDAAGATRCVHNASSPTF